MAVRIAPSILSADFAQLGAEAAAVARAGADALHVDVMDGHFVPNLTLGPPIIRCLRRAAPLPLDVHLMIEAPERSLSAYVDAGAHALTVHVEATRHVHRTLGEIRGLGVDVGVSLNPGTAVPALAPVLHLVDRVLLMSVNPGFGGQSFLPESLARLRELAALRRQGGHAFAIVVDGGIDVTTIRAVVQAGADVVVAGKAVFGAPDYAAAVADLRAAAAAPAPVPVA